MTGYRSIAITGAFLIWAWTINKFDPQQRWTLFFLNKSFADTAVVTMGISFVIGPLCRFIPGLVSHIRIRREFGLVGFALGVVHIVTTLLQWQSRFPLAYYGSHLWGIIAGIAATGIFIAMARTSTHAAFIRLGERRWKAIQRTGYLAFFLLLIHLVVVSGPRWQQWWAGKVAMPNSFLIFEITVAVLVIRFLALLADKFIPRTHPKAGLATGR